MTGQPLEMHSALINGKEPSLDSHQNLVGLGGKKFAGALAVPGQAIVFVAMPRAGNPACR